MIEAGKNELDKTRFWEWTYFFMFSLVHEKNGLKRDPSRFFIGKISIFHDFYGLFIDIDFNEIFTPDHHEWQW
nr:hypothetical protein [Candidatus Sigynarchaeota archaeon]